MIVTAQEKNKTKQNIRLNNVDFFIFRDFTTS